jgi:acyl-CoA synthetase (AMP-forming)/AMP-acid ligase II
MAETTFTRLFEPISLWAGKKPDAEAMVFEDQRLSWRTFEEKVDAAAAAFIEMGVEKGDRIAMIAMARPEFLITFMAASKIGAVWLGMSPKFLLDELRYQVGDCQPKIIIAQETFDQADVGAHARTLQAENAFVSQLIMIGGDYDARLGQPRPDLGDAVAVRAAQVTPDDEALLMYTSGSTGKPKGVLHTHRSILENVRVEQVHFGFDEEARVLIHFPINHVAADVEIGYTAIYGGATTVMMDRFDPQASLECIEREGITVVGQVPVMFLMQMQAPKFPEMDWSKVRAFVWGGSPASELMLQVLTGLAEQTGARLITGYGSTEVCGFCTYTTPEDGYERLARSCGRIVPPFEMRIVDAERTPLPKGEVGELAVRGPILMKGYLNKPEATADVLDGDGWYYTSDMGYIDEEGYLYLTGRKSEMFKTGGENVFPREVEEVLELHPAVLFAAVVGMPDDFYDEVGHAWVMLKPGQETDAETLRAHCKNHLANFKVPKVFEVRAQLPLLPNGKVNKMALKKERNA